jgi:acetyl esterase
MAETERMPLDPRFRALLDALAETGATPIVRGTAVQTREHNRTLAMSRRGPDFVPEPVAAVEDLEIDGPGGALPVRVYHPTGDRGRAVTYLHGGGWVLGDLDIYDPVCRRVANAVGAVVVAVDYRLAPEHPHPAPLRDSLAGLAWTAGRWPERRLGVAGDSAGASLAAAAALHQRDTGGALAAQLLFYPATDPRLASPSVTGNGEGYFLTRSDMEWFYSQYAPDPTDPAIDLLRADVAGVAPAVVATAEFDPLRDEGDAYAERLRAAGVPVTHLPGPGLIHGYAAFFGVVPAAEERSQRALAAFGDLLG